MNTVASLPAKWRNDAETGVFTNGSGDAFREALNDCADELDAALATPEQPGSAVQGETEYEWFDVKGGTWKPINRLPHAWERELGIAWRIASVPGNVPEWAIKALNDADKLLDGLGYAHTALRAARDFFQEFTTPPPAPAADHIVDANKMVAPAAEQAQPEARGVECECRPSNLGGMVPGCNACCNANPVRAEQPEGKGAWKLVPVVPTEAMVVAALRLHGDDAFIARAPALVSALEKIYRAMLAAAPSPEKADG